VGLLRGWKGPLSSLELIMKKKQACKLDTVWAGTFEIGVNEGEEGEGIWLMYFINIYKTKKSKHLQLL
jgi:hypothetical protein